MFFHDNGKISVVCMPRCGHTSMTGYFNNDLYRDHVDDWHMLWSETKSRRVLVLRNPIDRWLSAKTFDINGHFRPGNWSEERWFQVHSEPYLVRLPKTFVFDIIPFENLGDYIPVHPRTMPTYTSNVHHSKIEMTSEMREEYKAYKYFREHCRIISPDEWRELTCS